MQTMLTNIVEQISDAAIRQFVTEMLDNAPDYFWHVPASSTGKYHPSYALGEGGLVRHVAAACRIATELFTISDLSQGEKDIVLAALLLHDLYKQGTGEDGRTVFEHPAIAAQMIREHNAKGNGRIEIIADCVASHMGQWNTSKYSDTVLATPATKLEKFVHECDYLASRKCIEVIL